MVEYIVGKEENDLFNKLKAFVDNKWNVADGNSFL